MMLRQPMQRFAQMQASDIDIYRNEIRKAKGQVVGPSHPSRLAAAAMAVSLEHAPLSSREPLSVALVYLGVQI